MREHFFRPQHRSFKWCSLFAGMLLSAACFAADIQVGLGSYSNTLKSGNEPLPPQTVYTTSTFAGPIPTNDWNSSVFFRQWSEPLFAHPLTYRATALGFELGLPEKVIVPQADGDKDILYPHRAAVRIKPLAFAMQDARVAKVGDWSMDIAMGNGNQALLTTIVKGSPYSFYRLNGSGQIELRLLGPHQFYHRSGNGLTFAFTVHGQPYALFLPSGSSVSGYPDPVLTINLPANARFFSVAALPNQQSTTLNSFAEHAFHFVTDTRVSWRFDASRSEISTLFSATTEAMQGSGSGTIFGLYPHQWHNNPVLGATLPHSFATIRGELKLKAGDSFQTRYRYTGLLPTLPPIQDASRRSQLQSLIDADLAAIDQQFGGGGTYWQGKDIGKIAQLMTIAGHHDRTNAANTFGEALQGVFRSWLRSNDGANPYGATEYFYYHPPYGTLIGYSNGQDEFGTATELNDHHFHYGYWAYAAAQLALRNPSFARSDQWGGMIDLLIRDFANFDRNDTRFPFLRNFDAYEGHSWASGVSLFGDGNNQESSSESINAWAAMILWGELTGNQALRDTGIYLYTTEIQAINHYWFDLYDKVFDPQYPALETSMVWGGKYVHTTWWTDDPLEVHGINWLPITGSSLYLGTDPNFVLANYQRAYQEYDAHPFPNAPRNIWRDIYLKYLALADAPSALSQWSSSIHPERGETRSGTYHWLAALAELGRPRFDITANTTLYAVFQCGNGQVNHAAFNAGTSAKTVQFSDGKTLNVPAKQFASDGRCDGSTPPPPPPPPSTPYGAEQIGNGLRFFVNDAPWADVHYIVNNGAQQNLRMQVNGDDHQLIVNQLPTGAVVKFFFTIGNPAGGATDTPWQTVTVTGDVPDPNPNPPPTPYGIMPISNGVQFYVNNAPWADVHYRINNGAQLNLRMTPNGNNHHYPVTGLSAGTRIQYFFTIGNPSGGAYDTSWTEYIYNGTP